jgi:cysteine-rich repeat protein
VDPGEMCDDGNEVDQDGCPADCLPTSHCGNGVAEPILGEACDDGNLRSHDGCSSGCTAEGLTWREPATLDVPVGINGGELLYDESRNVVLRIGGGSGSEVDIWEHDGATWAPRFASAGVPPPRRDFAAAYDRLRERVVLFGGVFAGQLRDDTWEFDGNRWWSMTTEHAPPARRGHRMVFDHARGVIVLFGGQGPLGYEGDTWEYDGLDWHCLSEGGGPPERAEHAMVFDAKRGMIVLFGGIGPEGLRQDTWEYDGEQWVAISSAAQPAARRGAHLAYSPHLSLSLLFGGTGTSDQVRQDTWLLSGTQWIPRHPVLSPQPRSGAGVAYDLHRGWFLMFGGLSGATVLTDTWIFGFDDAWPSEGCDDGEDDDLDGAVDCADPDCDGHPCAHGVCSGLQCQ